MTIPVKPTPPASAQPLQGGRPDEKKKLRKACADFEAILLDSMFQSMRKTLTGEDLFGKSLGRDIYESMYYTRLSQQIADSDNNLGLGETLYRQLSQRMDQAVTPAAPAPAASPERLQKNRPAADNNIDAG